MSANTSSAQPRVRVREYVNPKGYYPPLPSDYIQRIVRMSDPDLTVTNVLGILRPYSLAARAEGRWRTDEEERQLCMISHLVTAERIRRRLESDTTEREQAERDAIERAKNTPCSEVVFYYSNRSWIGVIIEQLTSCAEQLKTCAQQPAEAAAN